VRSNPTPTDDCDDLDDFTNLTRSLALHSKPNTLSLHSCPLLTRYIRHFSPEKRLPEEFRFCEDIGTISATKDPIRW